MMEGCTARGCRLALGLAMPWLLAGLVWSTPARADDPVIPAEVHRAVARLAAGAFGERRRHRVLPGAVLWCERERTLRDRVRG